jgi:phosphopantetheinyl transferase
MALLYAMQRGKSMFISKNNSTEIIILYTKWDKSTYTSHELLKKAAELLYGAGEYTTASYAGGKPYFSAHPEIHFSISHSGAYWMCAFADWEVGLDIQREENHDRERLSRRFFLTEEQDYLEKSGYARFYDIWAAKEACLKYTGDGLARGLMNTCVVQDGQIGGQIKVMDREAYLQKIEFCDMYKVWVCSQKRPSCKIKGMLF